MSGKEKPLFYCDWCKKQQLGISYKNLSACGLVICQTCINSLTIIEFSTRMRAFAPLTIQLTLKQITDDNTMDYSTSNRKIRMSAKTTR